MKTQKMPEMPTREVAAMRTVLMATRPLELASTRASEEPAQMAAALAKIAEVAAKYAENEARFFVRMVLASLNAGAFDMAKRHADTYARRIAFVGAPSADVQQLLRGDIALIRRHMPAERRLLLDALFEDLHRRHPKIWIAQGPHSTR